MYFLIPTYCVSLTLLLVTLGEEMHKMINSIWRGSNKASWNGIRIWDKLIVWKLHWEMGLRHFYGFNLAMLVK